MGSGDTVREPVRSLSDAVVVIVTGFFQLLLSPLIALCWVEKRTGGGERCFMGCAELLSLVPGRSGNLVRKAFYASTLDYCARRAFVSFGALFVTRSASIGERAFVGPYCVIGAVRLGKGVRLGSRVSVMSGRHQHGNHARGVVDEAFSHHGQVAIGDGSWIGEGAIVMASVGSNCIVGAGSVVVREVRSGVTVVGNPARELVLRQ